MKELINHLRVSLILFLSFTVLTGLIYPAFITVIAQLVFPWQANGSLIERNGSVIGSQLIGQYFTDSRYFWGRPSATPRVPYNGENSSGSNLGPLNPALLSTIKDRIAALKKADPGNNQLIPTDLITASASGLDPDISPMAAFYQIPRIAKIRKLPEVEVQALVQECIQSRTFGIFGEPRVNVLELNIALDHLEKNHARTTT